MKISFRTAGWATLASGVVGMIAYAFLLYAVLGRGSGALDQPGYLLMFSIHNGFAMFQFLFLIPLAFALYKLSQQGPDGLTRTTLYTGVVSISLVALALLLVFPGVLSDGLYLIPQGVFGGWLIVINWRLSGTLPRALRWFGMIVGLGLIIFGSFIVGYIIFVSPIPLRIPAASIEEVEAIPFTPANIFLHKLIWVGSIMGVMPLPFLTLLTGFKLLRIHHYVRTALA